MGHVDNGIFLSYRRTDIAWALAIFQNLTEHGYDVFFDFKGIASGDFETILLANIKARAHFLVLLTPWALERCSEANDWLRREIETALTTERNIIPVALQGFDFRTPAVAAQLTESLAGLSRYNALQVPAEYFDEAMGRLREKYLNISLDTVLYPASSSARKVAEMQQAAAAAALREKEAGGFSPLVAKASAGGPPSGPHQTERDAVRFDAEGLDRVTHELAAYVGPLAKLLVNRAAKRATSWKQLYDSLAQDIPEDSARKRFLAKRPT